MARNAKPESDLDDFERPEIAATLMTHQVTQSLFTMGQKLEPGDFCDATDWENRELLVRSGYLIPIVHPEPLRSKGEVLRRLRRLAEIDERERLTLGDLSAAESARAGAARRVEELRPAVAELNEREAFIRGLERKIGEMRLELKEHIPTERQRQEARKSQALERISRLAGDTRGGPQAEPKGAA
jgi:hypothetical protein